MEKVETDHPHAGLRIFGKIIATIIIVVFVFMFIFLRNRWKEIPSDRKDMALLYGGLAALALLVQNVFSVDMRFGISFASLFVILGFLFSRAHLTDEKWVASSELWPMANRVGGTALTCAFFGFLVFPKLIEPYKAQKEVSEMPGFFNERLLDPAKSIDDLEKLAAQYPSELSVLEKLAFVYAKEMKTPDDRINLPRAEAALATYQKIIDHDPNYISAYNNMANINYTLGRQDEAIRLWKKCVEVNDSFLDAHLNLGKILYVKGELKESAAHFEKVLKLNPGNAEAIIYLKKMVE
jgi:tetratricopeptide (TPR) repeat protein